MSTRSATLRLVPGPPSSKGAAAPTVVLSEEELAAGLAKRDPSACDRVYRLYAREVWRMLHRILGDDPDLDDLHHEVFVQALRSAHRFRGDAKLKTWLIGIAVNCARGKIRARKRRSWLRFMAPEDVPETATDGDDEESSLTTRAVYQVLLRLPTEERIAFTLRYVDGMTNGEIADAMQCSTGTVKRRISKGSARFFSLAEEQPALQSLCRGRQP